MEPFLLSPQHCHNPRRNENPHVHFKTGQQPTAPFLPSLQRWIQHGLAWEPWTLRSRKFSFATINSWAIKQKLDSHYHVSHPSLCWAAQQPTMDQEHCSHPGQFALSSPLLKNCLIKISRVQLHNISLRRIKPCKKQQECLPYITTAKGLNHYSLFEDMCFSFNHEKVAQCKRKIVFILSMAKQWKPKHADRAFS